MSNSAKQWPAGYRINPRVAGPDVDIIEAFKSIPVAAIGDSMSRNVGTMGLRQYHARLDTVLCGPAVTVRVRPMSPPKIQMRNQLGKLVRPALADFRNATQAASAFSGFGVDVVADDDQHQRTR